MADDAEKFFEEHAREVSITEYFRKNLHMLGYGGAIKSLTTVIHELVSNALDACEEGGVLPEVKASIQQIGDKHYLVNVEDNGIGIPGDFIPKVMGRMLSGTKFHRMSQSRGQQGIGAAGAFMFAQMTSGKPITVTSSTGKGKSVTVVMEIDVKKNTPKVIDQTEQPAEWRGTRITAEYKEVKYTTGELGPFEYIKKCALANPHAKIVFVGPEGERIVFDRTSNVIPPKAKSMLPHPYGVTADDVKVMAQSTPARKLGSFLESELCRVSNQKVKEIEQVSGVDMNMNPKEIAHTDAEKLVKAFKQIKFIAPPTDGLVPIGEKHLEGSVKQLFKPQFYSVIERVPQVYRGGIPFLIEAAIAFGGEAGKKTEEGSKSEIIRFANRSPLLFDAGGCGITKSIREIDWKRYEVNDFDNSQLSVIVSIISPWIPYTSAGKQSISDDEDIIKEIKLAIMECGRKLQVHLSAIRRDEMRVKRQSIFIRYIPEIADSVSRLTTTSKQLIQVQLESFVKDKLGKAESGKDEDIVLEGEIPEPEAIKEEGENGGEEE